nr:hypothetical protein [Pseudomonas sp.]
MSKVTMPEPAFTTVIRNIPRVLFSGAQMEAYAAAKVREALIDAIEIVRQARHSIGAGALAENAQHEQSVVGPHLDAVEDEIRALLPSQ